MNRILFAFICICFLTKVSFGQADKLNEIQHIDEFLNNAKKDTWKQAKNKKGICIRYRNIQIFKTTKTREVSISFTLNISSANKVLKFLKSPDKITEWNKSLKSVVLLKDKDTQWISHSKYNIPFPFSQQDLVAKSTLIKKKNSLIVYSKSLPNYISKVKGFNRETYNLTKWIIRKINNREYEIKFSAISLSNSKIPRFIKDPIIQRKLLNSFIKLKKILLRDEKPV